MERQRCFIYVVISFTSFNDTNMPLTTKDGITLKRGDYAWEVGVTTKGVYQPTRSRYGVGEFQVLKKDECFGLWENCQRLCEEMNKAGGPLR